MTGERSFIGAVLVALSAFGASALLALPARAEPGAAPVDAGPTAAGEVRPTGRELAPHLQRPEEGEAPVVACSFAEAVCVHAAPKVSGEAVLRVLRSAEAALGAYRALGLPAPLDDGRLGGGPGYDFYLLPGLAGPATANDLTAFGGGHDTESAFTVMPPPAARGGCEVDAAVARALAHAIGLRLDAGAEDSALSMAASYLTTVVAPCEAEELAAIDDFQRAPGRSFAMGDPDRPDGALLFPWYLDDAYGRGTPGLVMTSLLGIAAQKTPPGAFEWRNEPDVFDALRATMKARGKSLDTLLIDFAVARAFVGSRSDGGHLQGVERFGDAGRVRFEWAVPFESLPRRLAPSEPVEAMGMTYLWVDLASAPPDAELTFVADWELPSLFRWALVKVDKEGHEAGRVDVAGVFGDDHAERTVSRLDGLAGILVAGVNTGSIDRSHPFDPDEQPLMPHGYTVTLHK